MARPSTLLLAFLVLYGTQNDASTLANHVAPQPHIAILADPTLPSTGCPSSADAIIEMLKDEPVVLEKFSADDLINPTKLTPDRIALLVVPTGQTFPSLARDNLVNYLRQGGDLVAMGGYAFNYLVRRVDQRWVSEADWLENRLRQAKQQGNTLLMNPGFEQRETIPLSPQGPNGKWYRSSEHCQLTEENAREGAQCARVRLPAKEPVDSGAFLTNISVVPGRTYYVSGYLRAQNLSGAGIAYMAIYQHDAQGQMVTFRDFGQVREDCDWRRFEYHFTPSNRVTTARLQCGFHQKQGTVCFDDFQLIDVTGLNFKPLNTSNGEPRDGLDVEPDQLGMFDASFPLKRVRFLRTARQQRIVKSSTDWTNEFTGWGASGVLGSDQARWIPLLETYDKYDRPRGAAAAMLLNYNGHFKDSSWAYFGINNVDLFQDASGPLAEPLREIVSFLLDETYLHNLESDHRLYREGETVRVSVNVKNAGTRLQKPDVRFELRDQGGQIIAVRHETLSDLPPGTSSKVTSDLGVLPGETDSGLFRITAVLKLGEDERDVMETGVVRDRPEIQSSGPSLRFVQNYFELNGLPMFLFGTDTYSRTYLTAAENPATWDQELAAARDIGIDIYENLQYSRPKHVMRDDDWRSFQAMAQLTQKHRLVFMPCLLVGHNTAIGDEQLVEQSSLCREYAKQLHQTPGLLYYINGDYQLRLNEHPEQMEQAWRKWLQARYGSLDQLATAWGQSAPASNWDELPFPPPNSAAWDDVPALDLSRFRLWLTTRWNEAHVAAIRGVDSLHPTTSEYYSIPLDGIDLPITIDGQDVSNIGFFERPEKDLDELPLRISFNDLRARGKGVSLGEYGVKTHPAWEEENGGTGYHIRRSEQQQLQLFAAVAHYGIGLGCSKIQNWCLRDAQARVFPWGLFYPNQLIPKDVAFLHRNQSIAWRFMTPVYEAPPLTICLANQLRLGNDANVGLQIAHRTFADLLSLHLPYNVIDDGHLADLPSTTRVLFYPSPFSMSDATFEQLVTWVNSGGTLFVTGDFTFDEDRRRSRTKRWQQLAGVEFLEENYPQINRQAGQPATVDFKFDPPFRGEVRPRAKVRAMTAEVLAATESGEPCLVRQTQGRGTVYCCLDPLELDSSTEDLRRKLYASIAAACELKPLQIRPDVPWLHVMQQPTRNGQVQVVFNTRPGAAVADVRLSNQAGRVALNVRDRWPVLVATTHAGEVMVATTDGEAAANGDLLVGGAGRKGIISLTGEDVRRSSSLLITPYETGTIELPERANERVAVMGEFAHGQWCEFERINLAPGRVEIEIDADRLTTLILVCDKGQAAHAVRSLSRVFYRPYEPAGY
jgi:hypothetical protein